MSKDIEKSNIEEPGEPETRVKTTIMSALAEKFKLRLLRS